MPGRRPRPGTGLLISPDTIDPAGGRAVGHRGRRCVAGPTVRGSEAEHSRLRRGRVPPFQRNRLARRPKGGPRFAALHVRAATLEPRVKPTRAVSRTRTDCTLTCTLFFSFIQTLTQTTPYLTWRPDQCPSRRRPAPGGPPGPPPSRPN